MMFTKRTFQTFESPSRRTKFSPSESTVDSVDDGKKPLETQRKRQCEGEQDKWNGDKSDVLHKPSLAVSTPDLDLPVDNGDRNEMMPPPPSFGQPPNSAVASQEVLGSKVASATQANHTSATQANHASTTQASHASVTQASHASATPVRPLEGTVYDSLLSASRLEGVASVQQPPQASNPTFNPSVQATVPPPISSKQQPANQASQPTKHPMSASAETQQQTIRPPLQPTTSASESPAQLSQTTKQPPQTTSQAVNHPVQPPGSSQRATPGLENPPLGKQQQDTQNTSNCSSGPETGVNDDELVHSIKNILMRLSAQMNKALDELGTVDQEQRNLLDQASKYNARLSRTTDAIKQSLGSTASPT